MATETYTVIPRRKIKSCETAPTEAVMLELHVLKSHFDKTLSQAAIALGISVTAIKKACRKMGIRRWPHRMVKAKRLCSSSEKNLQFLRSNLGAFDTNEKKATDVEDEPDVELPKSLSWTTESTGPLSPDRACPDHEMESQPRKHGDINQEITQHLEIIYQTRRLNQRKQRNQPDICKTECDAVVSQSYRHAVTAGSFVGDDSDFGRASSESSSFSSSCETVVFGALSPPRDFESPCASPPSGCIAVTSANLAHVHDGRNMQTGLCSEGDLHMSVSQWRVEDNSGLWTDQWRADLPTETFVSAIDPAAFCPAVPYCCATRWGFAAE